MPLPVGADGNPFAFGPLEQVEQLLAPASSSVRADHGESEYPEHPVDVQPDSVEPDRDLSIVASGGQLTVVRVASRPLAPTLQEPLRENARSTTCARQLTVARGDSQRSLRPPTQLESVRERAGIAASAEPHGAARAKDPAI